MAVTSFGLIIPTMPIFLARSAMPARLLSQARPMMRAMRSG
jgi:hypothetical protein